MTDPRLHLLQGLAHLGIALLVVFVENWVNRRRSLLFRPLPALLSLFLLFFRFGNGSEDNVHHFLDYLDLCLNASLAISDFSLDSGDLAPDIIHFVHLALNVGDFAFHT